MNSRTRRFIKQVLLLLILAIVAGISEPILRAQEEFSATVPDSLDLVEYANYGINGLTQTLDPAFNYEIFFRVD